MAPYEGVETARLTVSDDGGEPISAAACGWPSPAVEWDQPFGLGLAASTSPLARSAYWAKFSTNRPASSRAFVS